VCPVFVDASSRNPTDQAFVHGNAPAGMLIAPRRREMFDPRAVCDTTATGEAFSSFLRFMLLVRSLG
jgi:hypothetical protein